MDTLDFLQRVLPTEGQYVATIINDGPPQQAFFDTVEKLAAATIRSDQLGNNIYYAISSFKVRGNRKQENVFKTKVVALDVDCGEGKPFATQTDGFKALRVFITKMKLPTPLIVSSGRGLHVYWVMDEELIPSEWEPLALAMKSAAFDKGFEIDPAVTGDSARVLRPVGTHNPKNNAEVVVLVESPVTTRQTLERVLSRYMLSNALPPVPTAQTTRTGSKLLDALAVTSDFPPAVPHVVQQKCQQIDWAITNADKVPEPLWYSLIGVAAFCVDGENTALEWSKGHPTYSEAATRKKFAQWKGNATGPATCKKFESDRPKGCDKCKFKDKIGSPARLGVVHKALIKLDDAPDAIANTTSVPKGYKQTDTGIKINLDGTDIDICPFNIYPVGYGRDEALNYETVRYKWKRPHIGWQDLVMRQAYLADGSREFPTSIADQGVVLNGRKQTEMFQIMLRSYMDELRKVKTMTNLYATMGWKDEGNQFVIGDHLLKRHTDGSVTTENISIASTATKLASELYTRKGSLGAWVKATTMLESANMPWHQFGLLLGFAAPLMEYTGLKGAVISLYGPTGGGKSLIQLWQQSIYGPPDRLHFAAKFTQNSLFSRLGLYSNLPMTIDEVTIMNDKDVGEFCYVVSQGRDKARLNRNANEREAKTWATTVTVSTNHSLASKMEASGMETDAQLARLLEITIPKHPLFAKDSSAGRKIYAFITANYGVAGPPYLELLMKYSPEEREAMVVDAITTFSERYDVKFAGHERFWEVIIALADLGGRLAYEQDLVGFEPKAAIEWVLTQIDTNRQTATENKRTWDELLFEYMSEEIASEILVVMHTKDGKPMIDQSRAPRGAVLARLDKHRPAVLEGFDKGTLMVVRPAFKRWLSARGYDYGAYKKDLHEAGVWASPSSNKMYIGKDTDLKKLGQPYVVGFNLNHPNLVELLNDDSSRVMAQDMTLGEMKLVED